MDTSRLKKKILEKHRRQFKNASFAVADPVVIVIHDNRMALIGEDIDSLFFGSIAIEMKFNTTTGECVESRCCRSPDALSDEDPTTSIISGILVYRYDHDEKGRRILIVSYHANPSASIPLAKVSMTELCNCLSP